MTLSADPQRGQLSTFRSCVGPLATRSGASVCESKCHSLDEKHEKVAQSRNDLSAPTSARKSENWI
jgi:hypothetical protein